MTAITTWALPMLWDWVTGNGRAQQGVLEGGLLRRRGEGK